MKRGIRSTILSIAIMCILNVTGTMAANPDFFSMHHDKVPNFAKNPTIQSVQNGNWSNASTWNPARVPQSSDRVLISHNVTYDSMTGDATAITTSASRLFQNTDVLEIAGTMSSA